MGISLRTALVGLALIGLASDVSAQSMRVLSFAFDVPDAWQIEGNGGSHVFASGGPEVYVPPFIMAEACVPRRDGDCERFRLPDPAAENWEGCSGVTPEEVVRADAITEIRWICPPAEVDGERASFGASVFKTDGAVLYVAYGARDQDVPAKAFLESLSRSLRVVGQ